MARFFLEASLLLLSCLQVRLAAADEKVGLCCLCKGCTPVVSGRGNLFIDQRGLTCNKLALDMADPTNASKQGNAVCLALKLKFNNTCCDPNFNPHPVAQIPTPAPVVNLPPGTNPSCHLCKDGSFPTKPWTVVAILQMPGLMTCEQLYWMGRNGNIPDQLCKPMQYSLKAPCGCNVTAVAPFAPSAATSPTSPVTASVTPPVSPFAPPPVVSPLVPHPSSPPVETFPAPPVVVSPPVYPYTAPHSATPPTYVSAPQLVHPPVVVAAPHAVNPPVPVAFPYSVPPKKSVDYQSSKDSVKLGMGGMRRDSMHLVRVRGRQ